MPLWLILFILALLLGALAYKDFYTYSNRNTASTVGVVTGWGSLSYFLVALAMLVASIVMFFDNNVQYTVQVNKLVSQQALE